MSASEAVDNATPTLARAWHAVLPSAELGTSAVALGLLGELVAS